MIASLAGLGTKIDCAGENHQQFTSLCIPVFICLNLTTLIYTKQNSVCKTAGLPLLV
jgi:hypothetical protein